MGKQSNYIGDTGKIVKTPAEPHESYQEGHRGPRRGLGKGVSTHTVENILAGRPCDKGMDGRGVIRTIKVVGFRYSTS
jgi:hypothetical protein